MKLFNNLKQLYNYCEVCSICGNSNKIIIDTSPKECLSFKDMSIEDNVKLNYLISIKNKQYDISFTFKEDNTYEFILSKPKYSKININQASDSAFSFYISANCKQCDYFIECSPIELDLLNNKADIFSIDRECISFIKDDVKYDIMKSYISRSIIVYSYKFENGHAIDSPKLFTNAFIDLDFSKPDKVINKIKTLQLFV